METIYAALYGRYSKGSHQTDQSIEGQFAAAEKYAEAHGMTIVARYADRWISGRTDDREDFQRMLRDSAKKEWTALIVWKTDRIGRNREELAINKSKLKKNGVKIYTVAETIPDTPEGIILESVLEGFAEYFSAQLSTNVKRGMRESVKKGQTIGRLAYGYALENKRIIVDPASAAVVRRVFSDYAGGTPLKQILEDLRTSGIRTAAGNPFSYNVLLTMLKNRKYIGEYSIAGEVMGEIPAIVDKPLFDTVQRMISANRRAPSRAWTHVDYLLTGKLYCGHCESAMVGVSGTGKNGTVHRYYECMGHRKKTCKKKIVRKEWIEDLVIDQILALLADDELLEQIAEKAHALYVSETDTSYVDELTRQLADAKNGIDNLIRAVESGVFSSTIRDRLSELEEQKADLEAALVSARLESSMQITKEFILYNLLRMREYDTDDPDMRCKLIEAFVNAIYLYDDKLLISFNYTGGDNVRVPLSEIALSSGFVSCEDRCAKTHRYEHSLIVFFDSRVFVIQKKLCGD